MKTTICFFVIVAVSKLVAANPTYEAAIDEAQAKPSEKSVIELGGHLRGIARHNIPPESSPYYTRIQQILLAIPGHAKYFVEEVERIRSEGKDPGDERNHYYAETLPHLPSPETVGVLGELLYDMRDKQVHGECASSLRESAWLAFGSLQKMGIRGLPALDRARNIGATPGPGETWTPQQHLEAEREAIQKSIARAELQLQEYRSWWEEVKSGKRTLSFKGQAVEYRFKPDGTWETLAMSNPPDDGPGRPDAGESRPERRPGTTAAHMNQPDRTIKSSPWLLAASALLLGAAFWWLMRKTHGADRRNQ